MLFNCFHILILYILLSFELMRVIVFMGCIKGANALSQLNPNPNPNLNPNLERSTCIKYILKLFSPCHLKLVNGIKEALRN